MGRRIALFFLVPSIQLGGCTSFTVHLYRSLQQMGYEPELYRIEGDKVKGAAFPYGLPFWNVPLEYGLRLAASVPSMIVYCFWRKYGNIATALMHQNVPMVVHDPAEFHEGELALMRSIQYRPMVIRKANVLGLRQHGIEAHYVPHPYCPRTVMEQPIQYHGISLARIDFRKRTHIIVEANETLGKEGKGIHLFGEMNRIYEYHQLRGLFPEWRRWYHGQFPDQEGSAVELFGSARFAVDLTTIKGDGGGTQYTFFEAWNAEVPLILNRSWECGGDDEVRDGKSCVMVSNAKELVDVLRGDHRDLQSIVRGGTAVMNAHSPQNTVPRYVEIINASH